MGSKNKSIIIVIFLFFPFILFAGGTQEEDKLDIAERLIAEQRYDEATLILADIFRDEPEKFAAAQRLQEIINEQRNSFNYKAEELIRVLYDEKNVEKALEIIEELEQIDPNPSEDVKIFLDESYRGALIIANNNKFTDIMDRALVQLKNGEYYDAITIYLTGFDLHKEEFDEADYGSIVKTAINNSIIQLLELTDTIKSMKEEINTVNTNVLEVLQVEDLNLIFANLDDYLTVISSVQNIKNGIEDIKNIFSEQNNALKEKPEDQIGDYFCFYATNLVGGRNDIKEREGIENAVLLLVETDYLKLVALLEEKAARYFASGESRYNVNNFAGAINNIGLSTDYYKALLQISFQKDTGGKLSGDYDVSNTDNLVFGTKLLDFMKYQLKASECLYYNNLIIEVTDISDLQVEKEVNSRTDLYELEESITLKTENIDLIASEWNGFRLYMNNFYDENELFSYDDYNNKSVTDITDQVNNIKDNILPKLSRGIKEYLTEYERLFSLLYDNTEHAFNTEKSMLLNGEVIIIPAQSEGLEDITRIVRYPNRRFEALSELKEDLEYLKESFTTTVNRWPLDDEYLVKTVEINAIIISINSMLNNIDNLEDNIDEQLAIANEDILTAERFKNDGMTKYRAAQNANDSNRFLDAKEYINEAIISFDNSLEKQEDEEVRNLRDIVFPELIAEINAAENTYVLVEVDNLRDDGIQAFRENRFDDSEKILVQAQTRWLDTHVEEDLVIQSWLILVRNARSLVSGFELLETESRYAEITQRLNYATEDYLNGLELKEQGNITQATVVFESAIEKLNNIKISHPLLKEANILFLKIQLELDPGNFNRNFETVKVNARNAVSRNNDLDMQEYYSILKDYVDIIPDDREHQDLIYELEIKLGLRDAPITAYVKAQSTEKYVEADEIYQTKQRPLYEEALQLLSEAIILWPNNNNAVELKNRMDLESGNLRNDFLSADDKFQFSRAERLYNERNYSESYSIVIILWNKDSNTRYPPLIDLRNQLRTRLGL